MKTRRRSYSEDLLTINRHNKRVNTSENGGENALPISIDLVFEIFSRLPVKSIARCRCVSKIWASVLRRKEFTELFRSKSYVRPPQLLFTCNYGSAFLVFSSPQPQNPDANSPPIITSYHMSFSFDGGCVINSVVNGLVCVVNNKRTSKGRKQTVPVICNPSTGQSLPLKKAKTSKSTVRSMFGYDPIDKGFKVLSMAWGRSMIEEDHQVLSLGTNKWRMVDHCIPNGRHRYLDKEVCVNGVLYYQTTNLSTDTNAICCFDIRSEKFSVIEFEESIPYARLINHNGKLGLLWSGDNDGCFFDQKSTSMKLWVLEDVERQEWSKRNLVLPPQWKYVVGEHALSVVGVTCTNEIVLESVLPSYRLYVFYLDTDKNTIAKVEIQGLSQYKGKIRIFVNHVEDVKLM